MTEYQNEKLQELRVLASERRFAKLRALGREMEMRTRSQAQLASTSAEIESLRAEIESLRAEIESLRGEIQSLVNSSSWRITQPLRACVAWARAHFTGFGGVTRKAAPNTPGNLEGRLKSTESAQCADEENSPDTLSATTPKANGSGVAGEHSFLTNGRERWDEVGSLHLDELLNGDRRLCFPRSERPAVSIVVVLYNGVHLSVLCLESILRNAGVAYELVLVDNDSTDATGQVLERIEGAKVIQNDTNVGFGSACMQGAALAVGEYLCFLNNDAVLGPGSLARTVSDFRRDKRIGAVGGKLLLSDGRLQEAGSMVWSDGTTWGYGRGDDPSLPKYAFCRLVDYCSAALLATPRQLFTDVGGFDERFAPAYYEDTDYCFKLWAKGMKVLYDPLVVVHHYESASTGTSDATKRLIANQRLKFVDKWKSSLDRQLPRGGEKIARARFAAAAGGALIVYMNSCLPHSGPSSDSMRSNELVLGFTAEGHHVTCVSMAQALRRYEYTDIPKEVELADAHAATHYIFRELLSQYDLVWVVGPDSMRGLLSRLWNMDGRIPLVVYETEPITAEQDLQETEAGTGELKQNPRNSFEEEVALCQAADIVIAKSDRDRQLLLKHRVPWVEVFSTQVVNQILRQRQSLCDVT